MTETTGRRDFGHDVRKYAKIVAKVWADPEFGNRLRENPVEVLRSEGIDAPERTKVVDLSNEADPADYYFLVPAKPASLAEDLLELALARIDKQSFPPTCCCSAAD